MKLKIILFLTLIALLVGGFFIWRTDYFQEKFFPKTFYYNQVKDLEFLINFYDNSLKDSELELRKKILTKDIDIAQSILAYRSIKGDLEEAKVNAMELWQQETKEIEDDIELWNESLNQAKVDLDNTQIKLSKYK